MKQKRILIIALTLLLLNSAGCHKKNTPDTLRPDIDETSIVAEEPVTTEVTKEVPVSEEQQNVEDNSGAEDASDAADIPASYMITTDNYFDYQDGMQCSGYASAYALRSMGEEIDGLSLYESFVNKNGDGTVSPDVLYDNLINKGYDVSVNFDCTLDDLRKELLNGVPVVVLFRVYPDKNYLHYDPIVGYDEEYFYIAESLSYMVNVENEEHYNRKVSIEEFELLWDTQVVKNLYLRFQSK